MSKLTLTYSIPEEAGDARIAFDGAKLAGVLFALDQQLRTWIKHGHKFSDDIALISAREALRELAEDADVLYAVDGEEP